MIDPEEVEKMFMDCLFGAGEDTSDNVAVEGITSAFGFHPERLEKHKQQIVEMLRELPTEFRKDEGGGWSFLNACNTKDGKLWTGFHQRVEQLLVLGIAIGKVKFLLPREMWNIFPGGMPYIVIDV